MKLRLENINKKYAKESVLKNLTFTVEEGKLLSIFGISGSGKTTILKIITGLIPADEGRVFLDEQDITEKKVAERGIAYVFQEPLLFPHLTVYENISFGLEVKKYKKNEIKSRVNELLKLLKIETLAKRYPSQISGGQQQRVSIARALASNPSLLLMDEPFSGLDYSLRIEMGQLIKKLQELLNLTIIFVTHDVSESLRLSDQIALIDAGKILQIGDTESVYYKPLNSKIASLMGKGNWINGTVGNGCFYCSFGKFSAKNIADGNATMFFRPHQVSISKTIEPLLFKVETIRRMGKGIEIDLICKEDRITVESYQDLDYSTGEMLNLIFPNELSILPISK